MLDCRSGPTPSVCGRKRGALSLSCAPSRERTALRGAPRMKSPFKRPYTNEAKTLEFALGVILGGIATAIAIVILV